MKVISRIYHDLLEIFYPRLCIICGERLNSQEDLICIRCWLDLPVTNFHRDPESTVSKLFWGRVPIENATSFFHYRKGSRYQKVIHYLKYRGMKEVGMEMGKYLGEVLSEVTSFNNVDLIVPVPLHKRKEKKRGYNQSEWIAKGIAESIKKPVVVNNLCRKVYNPTQTQKTRFERWENVEDIFEIKDPDSFLNKYILLVDDVVTTGSTLEACASELLKVRGTRVSIATLAYADL